MKAFILVALLGFVTATWLEDPFEEDEEELNSARKAIEDYPETER